MLDSPVAPDRSRTNEVGDAPSAASVRGAVGATTHCDVLVIGGGPAGSTAAALLAVRGHRVTLLEKAHHPRFHIGESLLPANMALFERLGVADDVAALGMQKWGIEFVSPDHEQRTLHEFADAWDRSRPFAYQVRRSAFDHLLLRHAGRCGADVVEGCRVGDVALRGDGSGAVVSARHDDGTNVRYDARIVVDASGRDAVLATRLRTKVRNREHASASLYGHFTGAQRLRGRLEGNISIFWFAHGWFWFIPLADGTTSVGAVCWPYWLKSRGSRSLNDFLMATIALCPPLAERLADATLVDDAEATGNYSYSATHARGPDYLLLGDAFAFIDPVFSSGVYLAMNSAFVGAEYVHARLAAPATAPALGRRFDRVMTKGPRTFSWFIYRVTNPALRDLFMAPRNVLRVRDALMSLLAGDIFGKTPIWPSVALFKAIYRINAAVHWRRTLAAIARRRDRLREAETGGFERSAPMRTVR